MSCSYAELLKTFQVQNVVGEKRVHQSPAPKPGQWFRFRAGKLLWTISEFTRSKYVSQCWGGAQVSVAWRKCELAKPEELPSCLWSPSGTFSFATITHL